MQRERERAVNASAARETPATIRCGTIRGNVSVNTSPLARSTQRQGQRTKEAYKRGGLRIRTCSGYRAIYIAVRAAAV